MFNQEYHSDHVEFIVVDLFAGAGGTSTGFANANDASGKRTAIVAAAINHDHAAITSHWMNHPEVQHFEEDITTFYGCFKHGVFFKSAQLLYLERLVNLYRAFYPHAKVILWASLECTNFSNAKGGQSRDADSRMLANHLQFYYHSLDPEYIKIENVREFLSWGPMRIRSGGTVIHDNDNSRKSCILKTFFSRKTGKEEYVMMPSAKDNGRDFVKWSNNICSAGYNMDKRILDSADFGAYTARKRLFIIYAKVGLPITWPEPTHAKVVKEDKLRTLFASGLQKHKAVREVLELSDEGKSIFNRKKPLSDNTLKRYYEGLIKFVAGMNKDAFLSKYYSGDAKYLNITIDGPCDTIKPIDNHALVKVDFLSSPNCKNAVTGGVDQAVSSTDQPMRTIGTGFHPQIVQTFLLSQYHSSGKNMRDIERPAFTIAGADVSSLVCLHWIDRQFSSGNNIYSLDNPVGTLLAVPKVAIMNAQQMEQNTVLAKHQYLNNPSFVQGNSSSIDSPCPVIIARQDKAPLYLVTNVVSNTPVLVPIYDEDSDIMIKIKEFMALFNIVDIKMRMLRVDEMKLIQGFKRDYVLVGDQAKQKKQLGNVVHPIITEKWTLAMMEKKRRVENRKLA